MGSRSGASSSSASWAPDGARGSVILGVGSSWLTGGGAYQTDSAGLLRTGDAELRGDDPISPGALGQDEADVRAGDDACERLVVVRHRGATGRHRGRDRRAVRSGDGHEGEGGPDLLGDRLRLVAG